MSTIKLKKVDKPLHGDLDSDISWFCDSFGLSSGRDTSFTSRKIISDILSRVSDEKQINSDRIACDLGLTQGLVNHHIRNLIAAGILIRKKRQIWINGGSLKAAVRDIKRKTFYIFEDIEEMAEEIDDCLGLQSRIRRKKQKEINQ